MDLLPRDAELARRAAGGDGAAFVRLYDHYSTEVFAAALEATGSIEAAADATQMAFLRVLRWPPPLGAPDGDVHELLCALALGGSTEPTCRRVSTPTTRAPSRGSWAWAGSGARRSQRQAPSSTTTGARTCGPPRRPSRKPSPRPARATRAPTRAAPGAASALAAAAPAPRVPQARRRQPPPRCSSCCCSQAPRARSRPAAAPTRPEADRAEPAADAGERQPTRARRAEERRSAETRLLRNQTVQPLLAP